MEVDTAETRHIQLVDDSEAISNYDDFGSDSSSQAQLPVDYLEVVALLDSCNFKWHQYITIGLFIFGATGNLLSLVVMQREAFQRRPYAFSLCVLAVFNALVLTCQAISAIEAIVKDDYGSFEAYIGVIGCKLYRLLPYVIQLMDHWLVVFITAHRFVTVSLPDSKIAALFRPEHSRLVLSLLFLFMLVSQTWRLPMDTQEKAKFDNVTGATLSPASCTAEPLELYINIHSFFYEFLLLVLLPAVLILVLNIGVVKRLYSMRHPSTTTINSRTRATAAAVCDEVGGTQGEGDSLDHRVRKTSILLLALTGSFWLYIMPLLLGLMYIRFIDIFYGIEAGKIEFLKLCKVMNATNVLTLVSCADFFVIQLLFDDLFRIELRFIIVELIGRCSMSFWLRHSYANRLHQQRVAMGEYSENETGNPRARGLSRAADILTDISPSFYPSQVVNYIDTSISSNTSSVLFASRENPDERNSRLMQMIDNFWRRNSRSTTLTRVSTMSESTDSRSVKRYPSRLIVFLYMGRRSAKSNSRASSSMKSSLTTSSSSAK